VGDDDVYPVNMKLLLRRNVSLMSGVTLRRKAALRDAIDHGRLLRDYVTAGLSGRPGIRRGDDRPAGSAEGRPRYDLLIRLEADRDLHLCPDDGQKP
jgi:hypothetical protein